LRNPLKVICLLALSVLCIAACAVNPAPTASAPAAVTATDQPAPFPSLDENIILPPSSPPPVPKSDSAIPLIFSHDGAPDDIATMIYLTNHPDISVIGVIQSYGEQHPTRSLSAWQRFIYDVLDYDSVPIGVGAVTPLDPAGNQFPETWRAGADDFWGVPLPAPTSKFPHYDGVDLIIHLLNNASQPVTLLVTGAHTDIALALQQDPSIADHISQILVMGGAFNVPGNLGEASGHPDNIVAEWNIFVDPLAAKQVFNAGIPITVISLDGSDDFRISQADLDRLSTSNAIGADVLRALWARSLGWSGGSFKIWDIVAAVALTHPQHFTWEYDALDVITTPGPTLGHTITLGIGSQSARFSFAADFDAIRAQIFTILQ
jgi:pyrimidine-specific ribonucleoside hydrolase